MREMRNKKNYAFGTEEHTVIISPEGDLIYPAQKISRAEIEHARRRSKRWRSLFIIMTCVAMMWTANTIVARVDANAAKERVDELLTENAILEEQKATLKEIIDRMKEEKEKAAAEPTGQSAEDTDWISVGTFKVTHYCDCSICQGEYCGTTATGKKPQAGRTIAVDPNVISLGSTVMIDGQEYIAEDTGGAIQGNRIDIHVDSHEVAIQEGVKTEKVYVKG